jgi:hypothetical protein
MGSKPPSSDPGQRHRHYLSCNYIFLPQVNSSAVQVLIENVQNLDRAYEFAER